MNSTVKLAQLQLHDHLDQVVGILRFNEEISHDGVVHIFITPDSMNLWLNTVKKELEGITTTHFSDRLGLTLNCIINDPKLEGLSIVGLTHQALFITREDLLPMKDIVDSFTVLFAYATKKMPRTDAAVRMAKKELYFLGTMPDKSSNDKFGAVTMKRYAGTHVYEAIKLFLCPEHAMRFNTKKAPVSKCRLSDMAKLYTSSFNYMIEPHCNYHAKFSYKDILNIK